MRFWLSVILSVLLPAAVLAETQPRLAPRFELVPRREIDTSLLGVNAFVNDRRFGTIRSQLAEVRDTLGLKFVRVLFNWDDNVQRDPARRPNFAFYDQIVRSIPRGVDALVILTAIPSWMRKPEHWIDNNPRRTFVERWVKKVAARYGRRQRIIGFQIWNEPNMESNPENAVLGLMDSPENYVELAAYANQAVRAYAPGKKIVGAATTAIAQDFPETLDYNQELKDAGLEELIDVWAVHYYGSNYEKLLFPGGPADFMNGLTTPIWLTEVGARGVTKQRAYLERTLPFVKSLVPGIERAYIYQFTEATPAESTYGLKNLSGGARLSDLYVHLRDRNMKAARRR